MISYEDPPKSKFNHFNDMNNIRVERFLNKVNYWAETLAQNSRLVALHIRYVSGGVRYTLPPDRAAFRWLSLLHADLVEMIFI